MLYYTEGDVIQERYTIRREVGAGGFAAVYEAWDATVERPVALKLLDVLDDYDAHVKRLKRFDYEARLTAQVRHPNVVTLYDYGTTAQSQPFLAMELLEGYDLDEALTRHGPMSFERALDLFLPCLEGLAEGHDAKIVHRDLKPSNLMLAYPDSPKERLMVLDFGIARRLGDDRGFSTTAGVVGSGRYIAPELSDEDRPITPALDVYQMGLVLVEALTGEHVVQRDDFLACLLAHSMGELTVPEALKQGPLGPVLERCLARRPEDRYEDARALAAALEALRGAEIWADVEEEAPSEARAAVALSKAPTQEVEPQKPTGDTAEVEPSREVEVTQEGPALKDANRSGGGLVWVAVVAAAVLAGALIWLLR